MKNRFKKMSMQRRMTISFAIPLILAQLLIFWLCYPYLLNRYKEQIDYSLGQSVNQAVSYVESYLQNMSYLASMVENSWEIQETMSNKEFGLGRTDLEQWFEFYKMNKELNSYEFANPIYRFCLYVPDNVNYSRNRYFFYGKSRLEERADYPELRAALNRSVDYVALSEERDAIDSQNTTSMVTMFHRIVSGDGYSGEIGICSISIDTKRFRQVMQNANITTGGLVYLANADGEEIVSSNPELFEQLKDQEKLPKSGMTAELHEVQMEQERYYAIGHAVGSNGWQMVSMIPANEYEGQYRNIYLMYVLMLAAMMGVIVIGSSLLSRYYVGRLTKLRTEMQCLQEGNLNVELPVNFQQGDEIEEVYRNFNFMVEEIRRLMQEHYRLGKNVKVAEIRALQAQINPHFLYNTLDLINWIAMDYGAADIERITWNLARFYRLSLNHGKSVISIGEEVEHVQVYVNIENYHYNGAIELETEIPEELRELACLNIILQPFVENSIVHGIADHAEITDCKIWIRAWREANDIIFTVQDNGPGMTEQQMREAVSVEIGKAEKGYGVRNINFRIKLCFGEKYGVSYAAREGGGTSATIRIPALQREEAEKVIM